MEWLLFTIMILAILTLAFAICVALIMIKEWRDEDKSQG